MKVIISPAAEKDIIRQFRYYLVDQDAPLVALRYRQAVMDTVNSLPDNPGIRQTGRKLHPRAPLLASEGF